VNWRYKYKYDKIGEKIRIKEGHGRYNYKLKVEDERGGKNRIKRS
jgi:hypothetical protein